MGTLYLIGMGLTDENDMTRRAVSLAASCQEVFMEEYTTRMAGADPKAISRALGRPVRVLDRREVRDGKVILEAAGNGEATLLCGGDPGFSTNHAELVIRAKKAGIEVRWIHAPSTLPAAAALTGLSPYRFGRTIRLAASMKEQQLTKNMQRVQINVKNGYHTLILLEPDMEEGPPRHLLIPGALDILTGAGKTAGLDVMTGGTLCSGIARPGSVEAVAVSGTVSELRSKDWGGPLHILVLPGRLQPLEAEGLVVLTGAPERLLN